MKFVSLNLVGYCLFNFDGFSGCLFRVFYCYFKFVKRRKCLVNSFVMLANVFMERRLRFKGFTDLLSGFIESLELFSRSTNALYHKSILDNSKCTFLRIKFLSCFSSPMSNWRAMNSFWSLESTSSYDSLRFCKSSEDLTNYSYIISCLIFFSSSDRTCDSSSLCLVVHS